ncbi:uncharacterized protein [Epargyreus clarus]|uniref:uncharacterized protein n=1 Tax=Epargyreus clarus TaxID=520877 RepID=UPI003C2E0C7B
MYFLYAFLIFCVVGSLRARQADIDINRLRRLRNEDNLFYSSPVYNPARRSIDFDSIRRSNDYDDSSSGLSQPRPSLHFLYPPPTPYPKNTINFHQPREDPKLYYQSEAYLKKINFKNIDHEVAKVYPGREVVRAGEYERPRIFQRKIRREDNRIYSGHDKCIRCPHDRTLVAKAGSDKVVLQAPRLVTCSGHRPYGNVKLVQMYGPKFGSLVTGGSHVVISRITYNDEVLHLCKMQIHVIVQSCPVPKYLMAHCDAYDKSCNFTCKDSKLELHGKASSVCGDDLKWEDDLPICRVRSWCYTPVPPEHGHLSCKGNSMGEGAGMAEGSKCRIRCDQEYRPSPRGITVCRRGVWTHNSTICQPKNRSRKG